METRPPSPQKTNWSGSSHFYPDDIWLSRTVEKVLEPEMPIIDAHHHIWDRPQHRYLIHDYATDVSGGHHIVASVFVEANDSYRTTGREALRPVGETETIERAATRFSRNRPGMNLCAAIVAFADLSLGAGVREVIAAHHAASPKRLRGIRHASAWDSCPEIGNSHTSPPPHLLSDPQFRAGFASLAEYDLSFDAWLYHPQLDDLIDLARRFPDVRIIVDHAGGPLGRGPYAGKREEILARWRTSIATLSACPNVVMKLGGLGMRRMSLFDFFDRADPPDSKMLAEALTPYVLSCIDAFGPDRCMFESNFPVDKVSWSYTVIWNAFKRATLQYSLSERSALFHDTAQRVYRLPSYFESIASPQAIQSLWP